MNNDLQIADRKAKKYAIVEEDLSNFAILARYDVADDSLETQTSKEQNYGFILNYYRKKQYLILTYPSSAISVWDTTNGGKDKCNSATYQIFF